MALVHVKKAKRIAKAYEEAGFLFNMSGAQRIQQMALWAGITFEEAQVFVNMVENKRTLNGLRPDPMPGEKLG